MRILHLLSQTQLTGAEVFAFTLAEAQKNNPKDQVFAISDRFHLSWTCHRMEMPISVKRGWQRWMTLWKLRKFLIQNKIEVIHTHSRAAARQAFWSRLGLNIPIISSIHGRQHYSLSKKIWDIYGEQILPVCENAQKSLIQDFGMDPEKMEIFRNPFFIPAAQNTTKQEDICFLWVTRPSGPKGERAFSFLLYCLRNPTLLLNLRQLTHEQTFFQWIGIDPQDFPQQLSHEWSIASDQVRACFRFQKHLPDLRDLYLRSKTVLGSGRVAMEAGLYGKNIIAIGEHCFHGLVQTSNLADCWTTNFGDMGSGKEENLEIAADKIFSLIQDKFYFLSSDERQQETRFIQEQMIQELNLEQALKKLRRIYQRRIFQKFFPRWIPILMYHKVPLKPLQTKHRIFVTKDRFEKHLQWFQSWGMKTITFSELNEFVEDRRSMQDFPRRPLILTFDDGYQDNLLHAGPLLKKYGMSGIIYLLSNKDIAANTWDLYDPTEESSPLCLPEERKQLTSYFEIGSHCVHHMGLPSQSPEAQEKELKQSKRDLESEFSGPILSVAYPYGQRDSKTSTLAQNAGYLFGVNTDQGGRRWVDDPFSIFRVNIFPEETYFSLWKKTRAGYRDYFRRKRGR